MRWLRAFRVWRSLRTIRRTTGFGPVGKAALSTLEPAHLAALATAARRAHASGADATLFHLALAYLATNAAAARQLAALNPDQFTRGLHELAGAVASALTRARQAAYRSSAPSSSAGLEEGGGGRRR